jgi:hypothetical protein
MKFSDLTGAQLLQLAKKGAAEPATKGDLLALHLALTPRLEELRERLAALELLLRRPRAADDTEQP